MLIGRRGVFDEFRPFVGHGVDPRRNAVLHHLLCFVGAQEFYQCLFVAVIVKPCLLVFGVQDHGHAVVDVGHEAVGFGCDDGEGVHVLALVFKLLPDARKGKGLCALQGDAVGDFGLFTHGFPFVKAIGGDEAAAAGKGLLEGGFGVDSLRAGIDELLAYLPVFGPLGRHAPVEEAEAIGVLARDDGQELTGRCIVAWLVIGHVYVEPLLYHFDLCTDRIPSAHNN